MSLKAPMNLKEAYLKDPELGEPAWNKLCEASKSHPIIARALREGLYQDAAQALGAMQNEIVSVIYPRLIARELLRVIPTKNTSERFYIGKRAYVLENSGTIARIGAKPDTPVDITANKVVTSGQEWNEDYTEDVPYNVLGFQTENLQKEFARKENTDVIALFNAITAGDLAGGGEVTITNGAPTWAEILTGIGAFGDDYPDLVALNTTEFLSLFKLQEFTNSLYNKSVEGPKMYSVTNSLLGIRFIGHSQITKTLFVNTRRAGAMLTRQDLNIVPWENKETRKFGVNARERYGMGIIWPDAVARGTN
jgi:hypothetical protein